MSEASALTSIGRATRNAAIIRRHSARAVMAVFCIVRLADLEQMAGVLGPSVRRPRHRGIQCPHPWGCFVTRTN
jgi:hypothetical protein